MNENRASTVVVVACLLALGVMLGWFARQKLGTMAQQVDVVETAPISRERPDIFLITIDTLRADHLPMYGYERQTAPFLTELSRKSQMFMRMSSTSSWTVPSVASYITGLLPVQHGLSGAPSLPADAEEVIIEALSDDAVTLAEVLKEQGYDTYAIVANAHLPEESNFGQGFDDYTCVGFKRAPRVELSVERISRKIRNRHRPVFVWVHYFDPHDPYRKNSPVVYRWAKDFEAYQKERKKLDSPVKADTRPLQNLSILDLMKRDDMEPGDVGLSQVEVLYDSEIRLVDNHVQLLYGDLGIEDEDVVVITSDHGEEFREHGNMGHRMALYEESLHVPMFVSWPDVWKVPLQHEARISQADLAPTLAEIGGAAFPDGSITAKSFLPLLDGGERVQEFPVTAELVRMDGIRRRAIYDGNLKLIADLDDPQQHELYDLEADPEEQSNLAAQRPAYVSKLAASLDDQLSRQPRLEATLSNAQLSPETIQQLEAMGYIDTNKSGDEK